jgi:alkylation response protein AidB-like acyl-CoA dehydrogenase
MEFNDEGLSEAEASIQQVAHDFAANVMRPAGIALDRLEPEQVVADGSVLWDVFHQYRGLGLDLAEVPRLENAVACKVTGTQLAVEVSNQAFEILGGNATSKEYPIEKLLRDARMGTIADGTNDVLSLMAVSSRF